MKLGLTDKEIELVKEALSVTSVRYEYMATSEEYKGITTESYIKETLRKADEMISLANKILAIENESKKINKGVTKHEKA